MQEDDTPQPDPELAFLLRENIGLRGRIMMQTQLDGKPNEAADQTPESAPLLLLGIPQLKDKTQRRYYETDLGVQIPLK